MGSFNEGRNVTTMRDRGVSFFCALGVLGAAVGAVGVLGAGVLGADPAFGFCGFFVAGSDAKLTNHASQVVLLREGRRTVMTMSNTYQGPPEDFAMVVPVPVVLQKGDVRTLAP